MPRLRQDADSLRSTAALFLRAHANQLPPASRASTAIIMARTVPGGQPLMLAVALEPAVLVLTTPDVMDPGLLQIAPSVPAAIPHDATGSGAAGVRPAALPLIAPVTWGAARHP
jgi:hypothetical protein